MNNLWITKSPEWTSTNKDVDEDAVEKMYKRKQQKVRVINTLTNIITEHDSIKGAAKAYNWTTHRISAYFYHNIKLLDKHYKLEKIGIREMKVTKSLQGESHE